MESGGDTLIPCRLGKQITGELLDRELVERHIGIQRGDDPIAIRPDRTHDVVRIAARIGVTRRIKPQPADPFAVVRIGQEPIDEAPVGVGMIVRQKVDNVVRIRRQPEKVEREPAEERPPVGFRRRLDAGSELPVMHERIQRRIAPR